MNLPAAVRTDALSRSFGAQLAVRGLDFSVAAGELFGLVGPDGAGKTTTLRMLAGVLRPTSGDATLFGTSVTRDPEKVKHSLAYMSQRFGLYTDLTVRENLDFYADLYRVPRHERPARLERLFDFSGLGPFQDRLAGQLSGGMKQKLGLSCALVHQPPLLLLDEPTFGVDPVSRRQLWLIVHEMVGEGTTVIVSTSYMDEAERMDRVALLHRGRIVALDSPAGVQTRAGGVVYAVHVADTRQGARLLRNVRGVRHVTVFGDSLHASVDPALAGDATLESAIAALGPGRVRRIEPSMEDTFIALIEAEASA